MANSGVGLMKSETVLCSVHVKFDWQYKALDVHRVSSDVNDWQ